MKHYCLVVGVLLLLLGGTFFAFRPSAGQASHIDRAKSANPAVASKQRNNAKQAARVAEKEKYVPVASMYPQSTASAVAALKRDRIKTVWSHVMAMDTLAVPEHHQRRAVQIIRRDAHEHHYRVWLPSSHRVSPLAQPRLAWQLDEGPIASGHPVAFSPDGRILAAGTDSYAILLADFQTGKKIRQIREHFQSVGSLAFSPDGQILASASVTYDKHFNPTSDFALRLWNVRTEKLLRPLAGHKGLVTHIAFSPNGTQLASTSEDETTRLWDTKTGALLRTWKTQEELHCVAFSPDGNRLAACGNKIHIWNTQTGLSQQTLSIGRGGILSLAFSPDGTFLACSPYTPPIALMRFPPARVVWQRRDQKYGGDSIAFSPDGKMLANGLFDPHSGTGTVDLWNVRTDRRLCRLQASDAIGCSVAFSPNGKWLAVGRASVELWALPAAW